MSLHIINHLSKIDVKVLTTCRSLNSYALPVVPMLAWNLTRIHRKKFNQNVRTHQFDDCDKIIAAKPRRTAHQNFFKAANFARIYRAAQWKLQVHFFPSLFLVPNQISLDVENGFSKRLFPYLWDNIYIFHAKEAAISCTAQMQGGYAKNTQFPGAFCPNTR